MKEWQSVGIMEAVDASVETAVSSVETAAIVDALADIPTQRIDEVAEVAEVIDDPATDPLVQWVTSVEQNGIQQGTTEWLSARRFTIGGSNIATIMGENNYQTVKSFITDKVRGEGFVGNLETRWGNLFEGVIKAHAEHTFDCKIIGENMFVNGQRSGLAYSPDGLARVGSDVVLFEFKCPFSRLPNGKIPHHYVPQVKMGLAIIDLADKGLYMEGVFRRCSWAQLGWNIAYTPIETFRYGKTFSQKIPDAMPSHGSSQGSPRKTTRGSSRAASVNAVQQPPTSPILAMGMIGFYCRGVHPLAREVAEEFGLTVAADDDAEEGLSGGAGDDAPVQKPVDLGGSSSAFFSKHMSQYDIGAIKCMLYEAVYPPTNSTDNTPEEASDYEKSLSAQMDTHVRFCTEMSVTCCGILAWKLFAHQTNWVEKDPTFLDKVQSKVDRIAEVLRQCNDPENSCRIDAIIDGVCAELFVPPVDDDIEYA